MEKKKKEGEEERRAVRRQSNPPRIEADFSFFFPRVALSREIKSIPRSLDLSLYLSLEEKLLVEERKKKKRKKDLFSNERLEISFYGL